MPRSERHDREDLAPTTERAVPSPPEAVAPMPAAVLRMQATIGNRATGSVLAREYEREREWTGPVQEKPPPAPDGTVTVAGFGQYKLQSAQKVSGGMSVIFDAAKDAARFTAAAGSGKPIATVTIGMGGHTITLHDVVIASVQHSGGEGRDPVLVVEFNAARIDFD